jgi:hypothetical protein
MPPAIPTTEITSGGKSSIKLQRRTDGGNIRALGSLPDHNLEASATVGVVRAIRDVFARTERRANLLELLVDDRQHSHACSTKGHRRTNT